MWSDGVPFTADDVAYTYNSLNALGSKVKWGADVQQVLDNAVGRRSAHRPAQLQVAGPALLRIQRLQVRHRHLHDAEAHLRKAEPGHLHLRRTSTCPRIGRSRPAPGKSSTRRPSRRCSTCATSGGARASWRDMPEAAALVYLPDPGEQNLAQGMISNAFDIVTGIQPTTFPTVFAANPEGHHLDRPAGAVRLHGLVAALAVRQHSQRPDRRQGHSLGDQLVHRSRPDRRLRLGRAPARRRCRSRSTRARSSSTTPARACCSSTTPSSTTRPRATPSSRARASPRDPTASGWAPTARR